MSPLLNQTARILNRYYIGVFLFHKIKPIRARYFDICRIINLFYCFVNFIGILRHIAACERRAHYHTKEFSVKILFELSADGSIDVSGLGKLSEQKLKLFISWNDDSRRRQKGEVS